MTQFNLLKTHNSNIELVFVSLVSDFTLFLPFLSQFSFPSML